MKVPNQKRRFLNMVFSTSEEKRNDHRFLEPESEFKTTFANSLFHIALWLLTLPAIPLLLFLFLEKVNL